MALGLLWATATARRLCPDLIVLSGNMEKYKLAASQMRTIFNEYSTLVEPLSLDEAYIDVTGSDACHGSVQHSLLKKFGSGLKRISRYYVIGQGVAPNKFLAKIGSDWNKPNGLCVIPPARVDAFVQAMPVDRLFGVGKVTAGRLHRMGIQTCGDLRAFSIFQLSERFGSFGSRLYDLSRGY